MTPSFNVLNLFFYFYFFLHRPPLHNEQKSERIFKTFQTYHLQGHVCCKVQMAKQTTYTKTNTVSFDHGEEPSRIIAH